MGTALTYKVKYTPLANNIRALEHVVNLVFNYIIYLYRNIFWFVKKNSEKNGKHKVRFEIFTATVLINNLNFDVFSVFSRIQ